MKHKRGLMRDAEANWRRKTDDEITDAARHLSDYTEKAQRIIREELRFRGMADAPPTKRPIDESSSPVVNKYRDAYRVGAALVGLGNAIKIVGVILAGIIVIGSLSSPHSLFGGEVGFFLAAIVGGAVLGLRCHRCRAWPDSSGYTRQRCGLVSLPDGS
jgi:hypothetical protein